MQTGGDGRDFASDHEPPVVRLAIRSRVFALRLYSGG